MDYYDYFVCALAVVCGGILGLIMLLDLIEEFRNNEK